jgi:hypothetical protein
MSSIYFANKELWPGREISVLSTYSTILAVSSRGRCEKCDAENPEIRTFVLV